MRKLLLLAVSVSLILATPVMARGNFQSYAENTSKYQQYSNSDDSMSDDSATDWEDDSIPEPQYDSQSTALAVCGNHTVFINQVDNVITVDGITYQLAGADYRETGTGDVAMIDHYMRNNDPAKMVSLMVLQKSRITFLYKNGESGSKECRKPHWN